MEYTIRKINTKNDIEKCDVFEINNYQWKNVQTPKAYGYADIWRERVITFNLFVKKKIPKEHIQKTVTECARTVQWKCLWRFRKTKNFPIM